MTISFNQIPADSLVPAFFVEFDTSKATQGVSVQPYTSLLVGQRLSAGTEAAGTLKRITSADQGRKLYGPGSMLASMCKRYLERNKNTPLTATALDDDGSAVAATLTLMFSGTATEAGTVSVKIGGRRYRVPVAVGATDASMATLLAAEIQLDDDRYVEAVPSTVNIGVTARNKGLLGNEMDARINPESDDEIPAGLSLSITGAGKFAGGTANPDVTSVIALIGDTQYNTIAMPYTDSANMTLWEAEMTDRFGPIRSIDGRTFAAKKETFSNLISFGDGRNSAQMTVVGISGPTPPWEWAGALAGLVAFHAQIDPARPFQTLPLGVDLPSDSELFTQEERDQLLKDGIATFNAASGLVRVERLITMNQTNSQNAPDRSLLDVNTLTTLSKLRFDFKNRFQLRYPRHKLADDGTRFGPGQVIITPKIAKGEALTLFEEWEELGYVENFEQFKRDLVVERDSSDPNRLNFLLSPDLVNQFRIGSAQIAFLL